jgi:glycosyltransferase involved in cell wall biosynthesis
LKRVAFTQIGGRGWMGGLNYQYNLLNALITKENHRVIPILFLGTDVDQAILKRFQHIHGLEIVQSPVFNHRKKRNRLMVSLVVGIDYQALRLFKQHRIDVVFEAANFYGWRFPIKSIAWVSDLQHQRLRHYFGFLAFWKREIGFRMQILGGRHIMLSSKDAWSDFQRFYRIRQNMLHVVRFAVPVEARTFDFDALIAKYRLPARFFYLPNQFWRHKNHECVIRALAIAKQAGREVTVAVSGNPNDPRDPEYFPNLLALAKSLGVQNQFKVLGLIPYEDVQALMTGCVALINPSRFEGWSTTVEEAKSLGIRMILSDLKVHQEQAEDDAIYFSPDASGQLAQLLMNFPIESNQQKIASRQLALSNSELRFSEFAQAFSDMVIASSND